MHARRFVAFATALVGFVSVAFPQRLYANKDVIVHDNTVDVQFARKARKIDNDDHGRTTYKSNFGAKSFAFEIWQGDAALKCDGAPETFVIVEVYVGPKGGDRSTGTLTILNRKKLLFWKSLRLEQPLGWTLEQLPTGTEKEPDRERYRAHVEAQARVETNDDRKQQLQAQIDPDRSRLEKHYLFDNSKSSDLEIREVVVGYLDKGKTFQTWRCVKPPRSTAKFKMTFSSDRVTGATRTAAAP